ncbi:MAG TPA: D-glucuronyl C5-epimerase family protein [Terriglobales bacterium]|nr:D-glucuronyl C5-epimerase family protein [Terriglobales bacterium]
MSIATRWQYYRRIFSVYLGTGRSQLTFWHETPEINPRADASRLGEYYMRFREKADYAGYHDTAGIPMLDYRGAIGLQYNPIAIAQWGLANYNFFCESTDPVRWQKTLKAADWLVASLEPNSHGLPVWNHHFDWEYRDLLKAPWYSGLAQGQGVSLLLRAHAHSGDAKYQRAADEAFAALRRPIAEGGVLFEDTEKNLWIEEYLVDPPTHILNGFMWALWGVFDYHLATGDPDAKVIFDRGVRTLLRNLPRYDTGYWSLYEQSGTRLKMLSSPFYHQLHVVQLRVMSKLTGDQSFTEVAERWADYAKQPLNRTRALMEKSVFKLLHY